MASTSTAAVLFCCIALSMVVVGFAVPNESHKFISMDALECSANITETSSSSRKLIGVRGSQGDCPVQFDHMRMGPLVRSCRGVPSAVRCCGAFKAFACPYSDLINNNAENGCASDMFFQIISRGRLPPGIFSHLCTEGPQGLQC